MLAGDFEDGTPRNRSNALELIVDVTVRITSNIVLTLLSGAASL